MYSCIPSGKTGVGIGFCVGEGEDEDCSSGLGRVMVVMNGVMKSVEAYSQARRCDVSVSIALARVGMYCPDSTAMCWLRSSKRVVRALSALALSASLLKSGFVAIRSRRTWRACVWSEWSCVAISVPWGPR